MARAANSIPRTIQNATPNPSDPRKLSDEDAGGSASARSSSSRPTLDLESLPHLSVEELRQLWSIHMGRTKCPVQRRILIRELAWRYQERLYGGLDVQTKRLLNAAIRAAMKRRLPASRASESGVDGGLRPLRRPPAPSPAKTTLSRVPVGSRLIRIWPEGSRTRHEVTILDGGKLFEYRGQRYKSLSEIARLITGTRWSGPRFFGLNSKRLQRGGVA